MVALARNATLQLVTAMDDVHTMKNTLRRRFISHERLDKRLEVLARQPERFARAALRLGASFDARGLDLEISDPNDWRGPARSSRVPVEDQLGVEIDGMQAMGRKEERRLALRIEFARLRLDRALEQSGLDAEALSDGTNLPTSVSRRKLEWHALRLEMVERNLYLVLINVERYKHTSADRSDMIQAASPALFRAVDGFDWRRGVLFRTYAVYWLNEAFRSHLYNLNSTIRVPVYLQKALKHVNGAVQRLGDPQASIEDIARETGLRKSIIASARRVVRTTRSLDAPLGNSEGTRTLASELALKDDDGPYSLAIEDVSVASGVEAALAALPKRDRRVVEMRFGIGDGRRHIYAEIAEELGVSLERARQILVRAMFKMRTPRLRKMHELLVT